MFAAFKGEGNAGSVPSKFVPRRPRICLSLCAYNYCVQCGTVLISLIFPLTLHADNHMADTGFSVHVV